MRGLGFVTVAAAAGLLGACRAGSSPQPGSGAVPFTAQRPAACSSGRLIDSSYVVQVAAEVVAVEGGAATLRPISYEAIVAPGEIEEGILVRLGSRQPGMRGGGGLAFVDTESGCALALRVYE